MFADSTRSSEEHCGPAGLAAVGLTLYAPAPSFLRQRRQLKQPAERFVNDPGGRLVPERDSAGEGSGERGDYGGARRRVGRCEFAKLKRRRLGPGLVDAFRRGAIGGLVPPKSR